MDIPSILQRLLTHSQRIDIKSMPSQGIFYPKDFEIEIKKADVEDIINYEYKFDKENIFTIIDLVKDVVNKNIILNRKYQFEDIKSVDIIYIFLEIVKLTTNKKIKIPYFNDDIGMPDTIEFNSNNFNYFDFSKYLKYHDIERGEISINDYKFSMPSIGVEKCLTEFLLSKANDNNAKKWNSYSYDFLFFIGNKRHLTFNEIENLITIFNFDIDNNEKDKIKNTINIFIDMVGYGLKKNNKVIEVKSKIDLCKAIKQLTVF